MVVTSVIPFSKCFSLLLAPGVLPTQPSHRKDRRGGSTPMAQGVGRPPAGSSRERNVPIQTHYCGPSPSSSPRVSEDRGANRRQCHESDDGTWHAGISKDCGVTVSDRTGRSTPAESWNNELRLRGFAFVGSGKKYRRRWLI